jgi:hypothetical protein
MYSTHFTLRKESPATLPFRHFPDTRAASQGPLILCQFAQTVEKSGSPNH